MADFNYSNYSDALISNGSYRFAPEDANRDEYRLGLVRTAKGLINTFDVDGDGKMSEDEFVLKDRMEHDQMEHQLESDPWLTESDKAEARKKFLSKSADERKRNSQAQFRAMDLNGDGVLDKKEVANVLLLADANDDSSCEPDGAFGVEGLYKIISKSPNKIKEALRQNYKDQNMAKLGEKGDIRRSKIRDDFDTALRENNDQSVVNDFAQDYLDDIFGNNSNSNIINNINSAIQDLINIILQLFGLNSSTDVQRNAPKYIEKYYC